jgi:hypothetical protein
MRQGKSEFRPFSGLLCGWLSGALVVGLLYAGCLEIRGNHLWLENSSLLAERRVSSFQGPSLRSNEE